MVASFILPDAVVGFSNGMILLILSNRLAVNSGKHDPAFAGLKCAAGNACGPNAALSGSAPFAFGVVE